MDIPRKYRQLLLPAACIALLLLTLKYLLPLVLPVLLGIGIAAALSPLIRFLQSRLSLGRSLSAGVCVTGVLLLLAALFWLLAKALAAEAGRLYDQLPAIMDTLSRALDAFGRWAQQLALLLPDGAGDAFPAGHRTSSVPAARWPQRHTSGCSLWYPAFWGSCRIRCCSC